jgi:hypothetical protein
MKRLWKRGRGDMAYVDDSFADLLATYDATKYLKATGIDERVEALKAAPPTQASVLELELLRLFSADDDLLRQEIPELRRKWAILSGQPKSTKEIDKSSHEALLAEATFLATQIFRKYAVQVEFANAKRQTIWHALGFFVIAVAFAAAGAWCNKNGIIAEEAIAGMTGGFVSVFLRIYRTPEGDDALLSAKMLRSDRASVVTKPLLGALFALVLHLLFMSKLLSGGLFPTLSISEKDTAAGVFKDFLFGTVRATDADFAKLLTWCFIGGFAERFVPDILDRLTSEGGKTKAAKSD